MLQEVATGPKGKARGKTATRHSAAVRSEALEVKNSMVQIDRFEQRLQVGEKGGSTSLH